MQTPTQKKKWLEYNNLYFISAVNTGYVISSGRPSELFNFGKRRNERREGETSRLKFRISGWERVMTELITRCCCCNWFKLKWSNQDFARQPEKLFC